MSIALLVLALALSLVGVVFAVLYFLPATSAKFANQRTVRWMAALGGSSGLLVVIALDLSLVSTN